MAPSRGLGVDNILEVELVTAEGNLIRANSTHHSDLYWALRGGGGSNWGVITAITMRLHKIPSGGFTVWTGMWAGTMCDEGLQNMTKLIEIYNKWALTLNNKWGGLAFFIPSQNKDNTTTCESTWKAIVIYIYQGSQNNASFQ